MNYWLFKTEPDCFNYSDLEKLGRDDWNGVRNFVALKFMRQMHNKDLGFIYHTGKEKAIVGVAQIEGTYYQDPKETDSKWITIDVTPRYRFNKSVTLAQIKAETDFQDWELVRLSRLSIMPVPENIWKLIHIMGETPFK